MQLTFKKYHGAGNDFIMVDAIANPQYSNSLDKEKIALLCHRRFGIGADGLIILDSSPTHDFRMIYYNADGNESTMCGNGGRCIVLFAHDCGYISGQCKFSAIDGIHTGIIMEDNIAISMMDVGSIERIGQDFVLDTGSPHYVHFVEDLEMSDFVEKARSIRNSQRFESAGINVNFVQTHEEGLKIRTFERGVEDETLACGTGVVAAAICAYLNQYDLDNTIKVEARGGALSVSFDTKDRQNFHDILLKGPAKFVYKGAIEV